MSGVSAALPAQTAGGGDSTTLLGAVELDDGSGSGVTRVVVTPPAGYTTITGVATDNVTFTVRQKRAGSVVQASVAAVTLGVGNNLVAETPLAIPITNPVTVANDDVFDVVMHQNGAGLAVVAGPIVKIEIS